MASSTAAVRGPHGLVALGLVVAILAVLYLVALEQGALTGGSALVHELFHDGRHLLGVPCH